MALGWLAVAGLWVLTRFFPPDGTVRPGLWLFAGRFHPLVLHLPIALALLVPVLEWLGRKPGRASSREAAALVLGLACAAAFVAAYDGWLLGRLGGYQGRVVLHHLWGGVWFATCCQLAATLRPVSGSGAGSRPWWYRGALLAAPCLLVWASDNGGALSHGPTFLTEYMPARMQRLFGVRPGALRSAAAGAARLASGLSAGPSPAAPAPTVYLRQIQPIFDRSCVSCHGPNKVKGKLRLDSYAALIKGGDSGPEVVPWIPEQSELLRRVILPADDDDFMPSNGKNLLSASEKGQLRSWIAAGASDRQPFLTPGLK